MTLNRNFIKYEYPLLKVAELLKVTLFRLPKGDQRSTRHMSNQMNNNNNNISRIEAKLLKYLEERLI